jgi:hypothetical protein
MTMIRDCECVFHRLFVPFTAAFVGIEKPPTIIPPASKKRDMETALNRIVPGKWTADGTFRHTAEGEDDMPGHVKSSLMGASLNIPVSAVDRMHILATRFALSYHFCSREKYFENASRRASFPPSMPLATRHRILPHARRRRRLWSRKH